jgi:hypothetical protein
VSGPDDRSLHLTRHIREQYACPQDFLDFSLGGELSHDAGYFEIGLELLCYGRFHSANTDRNFDAALEDLLPQCRISGSTLQLPFDPTEIIDNLRLERYPQEQRSSYERFLKKIYYRVRPLTNRGLRRRIQKFYAFDWRQVRFPKWPVDTTVETLSEELMWHALRVPGVEKIPFIWFWPKGSTGCVMMTHDVETAAGRDFSAELASLDQSFGLRSGFQVVPEDRYSVSAAFLDSIRKHDCEVGVHDLNHDGKLFDNHEEFLRRAEKINAYGREFGAKGFRSAVMYRNLDWYPALDYSFDMSAPNVAHLDPQRGGCCTVMPYFVGNILELPLTTTQDYTLFHLLESRSIDLWRTQTKRILEKNGLVSFIVHPDYILDHETRAVYDSLLKYLCELKSERQLWFAAPSEIDAWWRERSQMSIVHDGRSWKIQGKGAERARIAFAKRDNGNLIYELPPQTGAQVSGNIH